MSSPIDIGPPPVTGSNVGTAGVGVFKQKTGQDLEFKKINAGSTKITVTDDTGNNELDIDVDQSNIDHDSLLNYVLAQHRIINDSGSSTTELLSASKILSLIGAATNNLDIKDSVETVATSNVTLSGEQTINGVLTSGSRVGVVGQTNGAENGIYTTGAGAWTRTADADEDSEVTQGFSFFVGNTSSTKSGFQYILTTADPITVGSTSIDFTEVKRVEFGTTGGTATEGNDTRVPSQDENDALAGTDGVPSSANKYVTDSDSRLAEPKVGSLSDNTVPAWDSSGGSLIDSGITDDGSTVATAAGRNVNFDANTLFVDATNDRVGIGTTSPSMTIGIAGESNQTFGLERNTTADTKGKNFLINSGGATSGATDKNGGNLLLSAGTATGSGSSTISLRTATAGASGTAVQTATTKMTITGAGDVGIATTTPAHKIDVVGTAGLSTGTAWTNTSDERLKDVRGDYKHGLSSLLKLRSVFFNYKKDNPLGLPSDVKRTGFIAQEVQKAIPEAVTEREDGYLELNVDPIHWAAINAIQDLSSTVFRLEERLERLEKAISV